MSDKDQSLGQERPVGGLARKLAATKEDKGRAGGSLTLKALRRSVARSAEELCELPVSVIAARQTNRIPEDLASHLSDKHLLVVLDCPDGRVGAATFDASTVTALIQQQTMGSVMGMSGDERNYTPTDAAMVADFLETLFGKVTLILQEQRDLRIFEGYRFGAQVDDVRTLVLGMEASDYRVINLNLDLDCGSMQGEICLVLPETKDEALNETNQIRGPRIGAGVATMRAELQAVLCKMKMPLREFTSLGVGDLVHLDQAYLYETDLLSIGGRVVAKGRLGQIAGARAVRINEEKQDDMNADAAFSSSLSAGGGTVVNDDGSGMGLSIAAHGLQEPGDGAPIGGLADLGSDLGGGLGDDLGGGLGGDLPMDLGGDLGGGLGDLGGDFDGGLPPLGDLDSFNPDDTAAEITELAGLPDTGT